MKKLDEKRKLVRVISKKVFRGRTPPPPLKKGNNVIYVYLSVWAYVMLSIPFCCLDELSQRQETKTFLILKHVISTTTTTKIVSFLCLETEDEEHS